MENKIIDNFFSFNGRLPRMGFFTKSIIVGFVYFLGVIFSHIFSPLGLPILVIAGVMNISLAVRRCHDLDFSGVFAIISLIPGLNIIFLLVLLFVKGSKEYNKYGPPLV